MMHSSRIELIPVCMHHPACRQQNARLHVLCTSQLTLANFVMGNQRTARHHAAGAVSTHDPALSLTIVVHAMHASQSSRHMCNKGVLARWTALCNLIAADYLERTNAGHDSIALHGPGTQLT